MSKLYELIRKDIEELKKIRENEEKNFDKAKSFPESYKEDLLIARVNKLIRNASRLTRKALGTEEFKKLVGTYKNISDGHSLDEIRYIENYKLKPILDYEKIFDLIESKIGDDVVNQIIQEYDPDILKYDKPAEPYIRAILLDMEEIPGISNEEKELNKKYLNFLKDEIVEKNDNLVDDAIDHVAVKRSIKATANFGNWLEKNGIDKEKGLVYDTNSIRNVSISMATKEEQEVYKKSLDLECKYSDEFKNKIMNLKAFIESRNLILKNAQAGESGGKEYGFVDYFNQTLKINKLLDNQLKLTDPAEKRANLLKISAETRQLQEIKREYNEVLDYIKENFNIDDVALCGNIYSGRKTSFTGDLSKFKQALPPEWDNENAPYGVILNGFVQFQNMAKICDTTFEEMFEKPIESFVGGAKKTLDKTAEGRCLKVKEASLGTRIGRTLVTPMNLFGANTGFRVFNRGLEFLNNQCEENKQTYDNINLTNVATAYTSEFAVDPKDLFGSIKDADYDSLKNLFAFGDEVDNLYSLSKEYPFDLDTKGVIAKTYEAQIKSRATRNPVTECRNLMKTFKDYLIQMKAGLDESKDIEFAVYQAQVLLAAKEYYQDFILKNNINPLDIRNEEERNEVIEFLNNPVQAFYNKYSKEENLLFKKYEEDAFQACKLQSFKDLNDYYKDYSDELTEGNANYIQGHMNTLFLGTRNAEKSVNQMLDDVKGGYFERKFDSTSKEFKAVVETTKSMMDKHSNNYGNFKMARFYADKYIHHKLPNVNSIEEINANYIRHLKPNEQDRVLFCKMLIKSCNNLEDRLNYRKESAANTKRAQAEARAREKYQGKKERYNERIEKYNADKEYASLKEIKLERVNPIRDFQEALKLDVDNDVLNMTSVQEEVVDSEIDDLDKSF